MDNSKSKSKNNNNYNILTSIYFPNELHRTEVRVCVRTLFSPLLPIYLPYHLSTLLPFFFPPSLSFLFLSPLFSFSPSLLLSFSPSLLPSFPPSLLQALLSDLLVFSPSSVTTTTAAEGGVDKEKESKPLEEEASNLKSLANFPANTTQMNTRKMQIHMGKHVKMSVCTREYCERLEEV